MVKAGDLVLVPKGFAGLEHPNHLVLMRKRFLRKGDPWLEVVTHEGLLEVKQERIARRSFTKRYEGDLDREADARQFLRSMISLFEQGQLPEDLEEDTSKLEQELWEAAIRDGGSEYSSEALVQLLYGEEPSATNRKSVLRFLDQIRRPGRGRFETTYDGDHWRPWTEEEMGIMRRSREVLQRLRSRLVPVVDPDAEAIVEEELEDEPSGAISLRATPLTKQDPDEELEQALRSWILPAMRQYVRYDGDVPPAGEPIQGWGGLAVTTIADLDLHRELGYIATDAIQGSLANRSSAYIALGLLQGYWSPEDCVALLTERHVHKLTSFDHVPDSDAEREVQNLPRPDQLEGREDLRHLRCFTIDPPDAKDFDDAVGVEPRIVAGERNGWTLWVHIADVSHYVRPATAVDRAARKKATSVYLPGRVLPMLPFTLADDLCSLRDDEDRYAMSVRMDIDASGQVEACAFHRSLIRVTRNMSYDDALDLWDDDDPEINEYFALATVLRSARKSLGIDTPEIRIEITDTHFDRVTKTQTPATQMIESFMVLANRMVAKHLIEHELPLLNRCHPLPDPDRIDQFVQQMATLGLEIAFHLPERTKPQSSGGLDLSSLAAGGKIQLGNFQAAPAAPADTQPQGQDAGFEEEGFAQLSESERDAYLDPFLDALGHMPKLGGRQEVARSKLLSTMPKATYRTDNIGHFGLGLEHYAHFTSPIRRYPDLVVHRMLAWWIAKQRGDPGAQPHHEEELQTFQDHVSNQEKEAARLERSVRNSCLVLAGLQQGEGGLTGRISGITPQAVFVTTEAGLDVRVPMRDVAGGPFDTDECGSMLFVEEDRLPRTMDRAQVLQWAKGQQHGHSIRVRAILGDVVQVRLTLRDIAEGRTSGKITSFGS